MISTRSSYQSIEIGSSKKICCRPSMNASCFCTDLKFEFLVVTSLMRIAFTFDSERENWYDYTHKSGQLVKMSSMRGKSLSCMASLIAWGY